MTEQEFETIIKPLMLLDGKQCQLMRSALLGNFKKWNDTNQLAAPDVVDVCCQKFEEKFNNSSYCKQCGHHKQYH